MSADTKLTCKLHQLGPEQVRSTQKKQSHEIPDSLHFKLKVVNSLLIKKFKTNKTISLKIFFNLINLNKINTICR